ncbi:1634_t:CDS:2 [Cetraspora pellucida]|uniref:1634_t:CDS:1 n=1 Tax=Cetraspora pellucida TaxID=1433469 RepID=A0A9N9EG98_9GLOM|nr:1634_t:CDS:2 [Cetraspora pellucida]
MQVNEAKYLVINVFNFGPRTLRFVSAQTTAGEAVAVPNPGAIITSRAGRGNMARFVFRQGALRGPEVNITFRGKKGTFNLYAQQNYAFLEAGNVSASASYSGFGEGRFSEPFKQCGGISSANGLIIFELCEEL